MFRIVSASDPTLCLSIPDKNAADRSAVCLETISFYGDVNYQLWSQVTYSGYIHFANFSGKVMDAKGYEKEKKPGQPVHQFTDNNTTNQRWNIIKDGGTVEINGYVYETCNIACYAATSATPTTYLLTCQPMGGKQAYLNVPGSDSDMQRWVVIEDTKYYSSGSNSKPAAKPYNLRGTSGGFPVTLFENQDACYRIRYHDTAAPYNMWSEWSDWRNLTTGSKERWGWGMGASSSGSANVSIEDGQDCAEVQFSVRVAYADSHSAPYTFNRGLYRGFDITSIAASLFPDGLVINWSSNMPRGGTAFIKLDDSQYQQDSFSVVQAVGSVTFPQERIIKPYRIGDTINVELGLSNWVYKATKSADVVIGPDIIDTITLTPTVKGTTATIKCDDETAKGWLEIPRGHGVRYIELGTPPYTVYPPLNAPWTVYAHGDKGYSVETYPAIGDRAFHITSQDGEHDCAITLNAGDNPGIKATYKRSRDEYETYGRERPVHSFQASTSASWSLDGVVYGEYGDLDEVDWLAHASHVLLRTPHGDWCQCAVSSVSIDKTPAHYTAVSISLDEEVW